MSSQNTDLIKNFYMKLREESLKTGGIHIAVRHIESLIRMATGKSLLMQPTPRCT